MSGRGLNCYLSDASLRRLRDYKYKSGYAAMLDEYILNPLADKIATRLPNWLAPNLITFTSLCLTLISYSLVNYYAPYYKGKCPPWVYLQVGVHMIIYAIFDCVDGKQARRTGSSSPLGQLFDHGCDSITCALHGVILAVPLGQGGTTIATIVLLLHLIPFFFANWEQGVTTMMRFGVIGVSEGELAISAIFIASAFTGEEFWRTTLVPVPSFISSSGTVPLVSVLAAVACGGPLLQMYESICEVNKWYREHGAKEGEVWMTYRRVVTFFVFLILAVLWIHAPTQAYKQDARVIMLCVAFLFVYQALWIIVCAVTQEHYSIFFRIMWPLPVFVLNAWSPLLFGRAGPMFDELFAARLYLSAILIAVLHYVVCCINQITTFLGIRCFAITEQQRKAHEAKLKAEAEAKANGKAVNGSAKVVNGSAILKGNGNHSNGEANGNKTK